MDYRIFFFLNFENCKRKHDEFLFLKKGNLYSALSSAHRKIHFQIQKNI